MKNASHWHKKKNPEPGDGWEKKSKFRWTDWRADGLTDWHDGMTDWPTDGRRVQYLSEYYVYDVKKGPLKILGNFYQKSAKPFFKKIP